MKVFYKTFTGLLMGFMVTACVMGESPDSDHTALSTQEGALTLGEQAQALTEVPQALTAAQQALEANADICDTVCTVRNWVANEQYAESREVLSAQLDQNPRDVNTVLMLTSVNLMDEEYTQAYNHAQDYLTQGDNHVAVMQRRAVASLLNHDMATALEDYRELIDGLEQKSDSTEQICNPLFSTCVSVASYKAHARAGLATVQYNRGQLAEAETIAKELIKDNSHIDPAHGHFLLALTASQRRDDHLARANYMKVLANHPKEPATLNNLGGVHYRAGEFDKAREYYKLSYENAGCNRRTAAIAWSNIAELDMLQGDYKSAEDKLFEALSMSKRYAGAHFGLAVLFDIQGLKAKSARHMKQALDWDEQGVIRWNTSFFHEDWDTHFKALIALHSGDTAKAADLFGALRTSSFAVLQTSAQQHMNQDSSRYIHR